MKKIGVPNFLSKIGVIVTILFIVIQDSLQQDPGQIAEGGFKNFMSDVISNFPEWIRENRLDPTPPITQVFSVDIDTGPISLRGSIYNVSVIGLSSIDNYTFEPYYTSYATLRIGMRVYLRHGGIQGNYNVTGQAVETFPLNVTSTFKVVSDNLKINIFIRFTQTSGRIILLNLSTVSTSTYNDFEFEKISLSAKFDNLFDLSPTITPEYEKYVTDHLATILAEKITVFFDPLLCRVCT
ncbi:uncharacterized protein LOC118436735 [Folsomia candida]|uniref:uncharacterized protein LOC118436735 n=1 Tax=Folsomia candida TaxID=158441 RepID=UPI001604B194|nr:uncharacterized protein LOC118436735 [Folsomia candida]